MQFVDVEHKLVSNGQSRERVLESYKVAVF
jgi:hypothetical protein